MIRTAADTTAEFIDVGGGASTLVDDLLDLGYTKVSVLDVASIALAVARRGHRFAAVADQVCHPDPEPRLCRLGGGEPTPDRFTELVRFRGVEGKTWNHPVLVGDVLLIRNGQEMAAFRLSLARR